MIHEFILECPAFSINRYHYATKKIKTMEARAWEATVLECLEAQQKPLKAIADEWKAKGGTFKLSITMYYPPHVYINQAGTVSARTFDLSNCEKPLIDLLFLRTMDVDDRYIVELYSCKKEGSRTCIKMQLELQTESQEC